MKLTTKLRRIAAVLVAATALATGPAIAADFPTKSIELIVPYGAGGLTDSFARAIAKAAEAQLPGGHSIVVINKPGGGATIGATAAFTAKPDGYTLLFTTSSPIALQPLYGKTAYQPGDFQGIIRTYNIPSAMNVHSSSDIKTFDDWLTWVKANPGKFTYGTSGGTGSGGHIATEQLATALGVKLRHIPYEGSAALKAALMGDQIMGANSLPDIHRGGEIRPIIFVTETRPAADVYDAVPTTKELGIPAVVEFFSGIVGHKDIPAETVSVLHDAFKVALDDPAVLNLFAKYKFSNGYAGPDEFNAIMARAVEANTVTMKSLGLIK